VVDCLTNDWWQSRLSISTKMRLYNTLVKSVLLYGAETWTMLKSDVHKIEAFHMTCQRHILGIRWYDVISNAEVFDRIHEESIITTQVQRRRLPLFENVSQLPDTVPANAVLRLCVYALSGRRIDVRSMWKRQHGHPRNRWTSQVELDTGLKADAAWTAAAELDAWRALRPTASQAVQWVSEWVSVQFQKIIPKWLMRYFCGRDMFNPYPADKILMDPVHEFNTWKKY